MYRNLYNCLELGSNTILRFAILFITNFVLVIDGCDAQKPVGKFQTDSIEIGRPIAYTLSYHHLPSAEVFFPDTTYNFYPFELAQRTIFPTSTNKGISIDSVVYTLVSFDIQKNQKLELPIYLHSKSDCTAVYSLADSVFLKEMIKTNPDSLALKTNTQLLPLPQQANYPKILKYLLSLLSIIAVVYAFFGRLIRKHYQLFLFSRRHHDFQINYRKHTRSTLDDISIGSALVLWKKHLEWLEKRPYTSYTSKEIILNLPNERLEEALREVDSAIYGGILSTQMPLAMEILLKEATELYKNRREKLATRL